MDFKNHPEKSTEFINAWVSENTNGKVNDLIPEGVINQNTALIIANAVALKVALLRNKYS